MKWSTSLGVMPASAKALGPATRKARDEVKSASGSPSGSFAGSPSERPRFPRRQVQNQHGSNVEKPCTAAFRLLAIPLASGGCQSRKIRMPGLDRWKLEVLAPAP